MTLRPDIARIHRNSGFDPHCVSAEWVASAYALIWELANTDGSRMKWFVERARGHIGVLERADGDDIRNDRRNGSGEG